MTEQAIAHPDPGYVPVVSVVMSARNESPYIDQAVASVLAQSFTDFELVIRDDGSTDDTGARLEDWARRDPRIRLCRADISLGLAGGGNFVVGLARAPLVARMDADDIADPNWLARLYATIVDRPDVVLVGCLWSGIDSGGRPVRVADRARAGRPSIFPPFGHGSSMFRRAAFDAVGGYRPQCAYWEDYDFVLRLAGQGVILFLPDDLYRYRFASTSTRLVSDQREVERAIDTAFACAAAYRQTGDHEAALAHAAQAVPGEPTRPTPRTLVSLSSNRVWNGKRPGIWRRVVTGTRWPMTRETLASLAFATLAEISPRMLRAGLAATIRFRARRAALQPGGAPVVWNPRAALGHLARNDAGVANAFALVAASCIPAGSPHRTAALARVAAAPIDARALLQLTRWHRVAPFVRTAVDEGAIALPAKAARTLADDARRARLKAMANAAEEARLALAARAADCDMVFVKGASLAALVHPDPHAKSAWDVDVLIDPAALPAVRRVLEDEGYRLSNPPATTSDRALRRWHAGMRESLWLHAVRGTAVELHTALCESGGMMAGVGMGSPRQTATVAGVAVSTLAEAELFAFLCVHGQAHGWARLKWLADVAALVARSTRTPEELHAAAVGIGAGRCPGVALLMCRDLLGLELPDALVARLRADPVVDRMIEHSRRAMDRVGDPARSLSPTGVREIVSFNRNQYWLAPGLGYRLRTFWSQWRRLYSPNQAKVPTMLLPIVQLGWLPARLLMRGRRRA